MKKEVIFHVYALTLFFILYINIVQGQDPVIDYKAKLIYNTTRLVEWPDDYKNQDFIIGIYGNSELADYLEKLVINRKVGVNNIIVKVIKSVEEIDKIHILYIASFKSGKKDFQDILNKLNGKSTLIITEREGITNDGSAINFVVRNDILKFELKESNVTKYGLIVNSRLKDLAIVL